MAKTEEYLSQIKYAEHRNVTKGYISRMVKEGRLHLIKGKLNVEMSDAELDNKSNEEKGQKRNEALDIFVYNFVALKILNPNFEVLEKNMAGIEVKPLKKVNKPYKIRREGSFVNGFR